MTLNPPLLLVSALFFLALTSVFYLTAWVAATMALRFGGFSHVANKRVLLIALTLPPFLAVVPTVSGAMLKHSHAAQALEHHSAVCGQVFTGLLAAWHFAGSGAVVDTILGALVNGSAWLLVGSGLFLVLRLVRATLALERGITMFLQPPSPPLSRSLARVGQQIPLDAARFHECAFPATYSSVLGLRRLRCVLSREFVASAAAEELDAVVAHEAAHIRAGDVWVTLLVSALCCLFFLLRPVRLLAHRWREEAELACDAAAIRVTRRPLALAAAILRASGMPVSLPEQKRALPTVAMSFTDESSCSAGKRVERLMAQADSASPAEVPESALKLWSGWLTTLLLGALGVAALSSPQMICYAHCSLEAVAHLIP